MACSLWLVEKGAKGCQNIKFGTKINKRLSWGRQSVPGAFEEGTGRPKEPNGAKLEPTFFNFGSQFLPTSTYKLIFESGPQETFILFFVGVPFRTSVGPKSIKIPFI